MRPGLVSRFSGLVRFTQQGAAVRPGLVSRFSGLVTLSQSRFSGLVRLSQQVAAVRLESLRFV